MQKHININCLLVEYPGYGVYEGQPSSERMLADALIVYDFLKNEVGYDGRHIFAMGRSIGSGPAAHLAAHR
jgi:abhydrolase domain-containing protein 17